MTTPTNKYNAEIPDIYKKLTIDTGTLDYKKKIEEDLVKIIQSTETCIVQYKNLETLEDLSNFSSLYESTAKKLGTLNLEFNEYETLFSPNKAEEIGTKIYQLNLAVECLDKNLQVDHS